MCPFTVASDFWRNFWTSCLMSPGHVERNLFFISDISVDVHGLHSARWRQVHRSAFDLDSYKLPEKWRSGIFIPSYFHFVRVLEGPCIYMFDCHVFRVWCVCWSFCWWCVPFYHQKLRGIRCRRTCRLVGVPCFWGQGKCVHVVLRLGECPEELKQCGRNRWCVRLACGCLVDLLRFFCSDMDFSIKKKSRCSRVCCRKIVYMFLCDSVCCCNDVYIFIV